MARTTFDVAELDDDFYRIRILSDQGYDIYLNSHKIHSYDGFANVPEYRKIMLSGNVTKLLKKGANTLAVFCTVRYEKDKKTQALQRIAQMDLWLEGLKKKEVEP